MPGFSVGRPLRQAIRSTMPVNEVRRVARARRFSLRTEDSYRQHVREFSYFHDRQHRGSSASRKSAPYLTHLATDKHVCASAQNVAFRAPGLHCIRTQSQAAGAHVPVWA
jgi:hypothetical protein